MGDVCLCVHRHFYEVLCMLFSAMVGKRKLISGIRDSSQYQNILILCSARSHMSDFKKTSTYSNPFILCSYFLLYMYIYSSNYNCIRVHLGITFYLFVSLGGVKDRGSTYKLCNVQSAFQN